MFVAKAEEEEEDDDDEEEEETEEEDDDEEVGEKVKTKQGMRCTRTLSK